MAEERKARARDFKARPKSNTARRTAFAIADQFMPATAVKRLIQGRGGKSELKTLANYASMGAVAPLAFGASKDAARAGKQLRRGDYKRGLGNLGMAALAAAPGAGKVGGAAAKGARIAKAAAKGSKVGRKGGKKPKGRSTPPQGYPNKSAGMDAGRAKPNKPEPKPKKERTQRQDAESADRAAKRSKAIEEGRVTDVKPRTQRGTIAQGTRRAMAGKDNKGRIRPYVGDKYDKVYGPVGKRGITGTRMDGDKAARARAEADDDVSRFLRATGKGADPEVKRAQQEYSRTMFGDFLDRRGRGETVTELVGRAVRRDSKAVKRARTKVIKETPEYRAKRGEVEFRRRLRDGELKIADKRRAGRYKGKKARGSGNLDIPGTIARRRVALDEASRPLGKSRKSLMTPEEVAKEVQREMARGATKGKKTARTAVSKSRRDAAKSKSTVSKTKVKFRKKSTAAKTAAKQDPVTTTKPRTLPTAKGKATKAPKNINPKGAFRISKSKTGKSLVLVPGKGRVLREAVGRRNPSAGKELVPVTSKAKAASSGKELVKRQGGSYIPRESRLDPARRSKMSGKGMNAYQKRQLRKVLATGATSAALAGIAQRQINKKNAVTDEGAKPTPTRGGSRPTPKQLPKSKPGGRRGYTVQGGDSLSSIAKKHGVTLEELLAANKGRLTKNTPLFRGSLVRLPKKASDPAAIGVAGKSRKEGSPQRKSFVQRKYGLVVKGKDGKPRGRGKLRGN